MKREFKLQTSGFKLVAIVLCSWLIALAVSAVTTNPYEAIVGRNVFGLKPPTPVAPAPPPPAAAAGITIKLQGISTILERRQVMLKVKTAARPPEPAKEKSYLWSEGQGEDDIEVLEIDAATGVVKIKNHDTTLSLTMKDDSEKPVSGAALPAPGVPGLPSPQFPGLPAPGNPGNPGNMTPGAGPSGGGAGAVPRTLPTRSLRTSGADGARFGEGAATGSTGSTGSAITGRPSQPLVDNQPNTEENLALYEINRVRNNQLRQSGVNVPPIPPHPYLKGSDGSTPTTK